MKSSRILIIWVGMLLAACGVVGEPAVADSGLLISSFLFDFSKEQYDWQADFADYPVDSAQAASYLLSATYTARPENLGSGVSAMMLTGNNQGEKLFMYMKKKVTGLVPDVNYTVIFEIELASELPAKGLGKEVLLKAGATYSEPKTMIDNGNYVLNVDKGESFNRGEDMVPLGNIGTTEGTKDFQLITRSNGETSGPFIAKSNSKGEMWLMVGTETTFHGITTVYYSKVNVILSSSNQQ
jgi:hypothetical protein